MSMKLYSTEPEFCGTCGAFLPLPDSFPATAACTVCATTINAKEKEYLVCRMEKVYERTVADTENAREGEGESTVEHICPRCAHTVATFSTLQTRSADEGQTVFYTCTKCKKKTIEYS